MDRSKFLRSAAIAVMFVVLASCSKTDASSSRVRSAPAGGQEAQYAVLASATTANRPWYADRLEKLGFYVFPSPVDVGDFSVDSLVGGSSSLSAAKGKVVLLNFWATWCPPCRAEMPSIESLWNKSRNIAFTIMAVSVGEDKATVKKFIDEQKYSYPIYLDPSSKLGAAFNASSIPTTYIFDKAGKAIAGTKGAQEYDSQEFLSLVAELASK